MQKYEYHIESVDFIESHDDSLDQDLKILDGLGADGWELVSIIRAGDEATDRRLLYFFKRPLQ